MDKYTAARLRKEFVGPVAELANRLTSIVQQLENAVNDGELAHDWLPINEKVASDAVNTLTDFCETELEGKLKKAKRGTIKYAEIERRLAARDEKGDE